MHRNDYALIGIGIVASLLILIPLGIGLADAQISNSTLTIITNSTGTFYVPAFTNSTVIEPFDQEFQYTLDSDPIQLNTGSNMVFINSDCSVQIKDYSNNIIFENDDYIVRVSDYESDNWTDMEINNATCNIFSYDNAESLEYGKGMKTVQENFEGVLTKYYDISNPEKTKISVEFENKFYPNSKFMTYEQITLADQNITFNGDQIDLANFVGQSFDRSVLDNYTDVLIGFNNNTAWYQSDVGFENLWSVDLIDSNKINLNYGKTDTLTPIGEKYVLDPLIWGTSSSIQNGVLRFDTGSWTSPTIGSNGSTATKFNISYGSHSGWATSYVYLYASDFNNALAGNDFTWVLYNHQGTNYGGTGVTFYMTNGDYVNCGSGSSNQSLSYASKGCTSTSQGNSASSGTSGLNGNIVITRVGNTYTMSYAGFTKSVTGTLDYIQMKDSRWTYAFSNSIYMETKSFNDPNYVPPTVPTAPQTLTTSQSTANEIILNWLAPSSDGNSAITNYKIYLDGSLIDTIGNVLTYTDSISGGEIGSSLTYKVVAVNGIGDSPDSNTSSITSWNVPDQVTGLSAVTGDPITMTWNTPSSDDTITNYKIYRDGTLLDTIGVTNSYTDSTGVPATSYDYSVSAVSAVGEGQQSATSTAIYGVPPDSPSLVLTHDSSNLNISVAITNGASMGTGTFTQWNIERSADGSTNWTVVGTPTTTPFTDTVPSTGDWYYRATTQSDHGTSAYSSIVNIAHVDPDLPSITASYYDPNSSDIQVVITDGASFGTGTFTSYSIERSADGSTGWTVVGTPTASPFIDTTTPSVGNWYYRATTITAHGTSAYSSNALASPIAPDPPTNLTSVISNPDPNPLTISLDWDSPINFGSGTLTGYEIYRDGSLITTTGTASQYDDTVTVQGTYVYTIKTVTNHAVSSLSGSTTISTPTQPSADSSVTLSIDNPNPNPLDITVSLVAPSSNGGSAITGYNIFSSPDDITYTIVSSNVNTAQTITVVNSGTWYFKSQAINNVGTAGLGNAVSITTPSVPSAVSDLSGSTVSDTVINLTWSAPNNGGSVIQTFSIQNDASGTFTQIGTVGGGVTTFTHTGLSDGTNYNYQVVAVNNVGSSVPSNQASAWTLPSAPVNLVANTISSGDTLELEWDQPTGTVTEYRVQRALMGATNWATSQTVSFATACSGAVCTVQDTGLTSGTEFQFRIVAVNLGGDSDYSNIASNWTVPSPPSNLTVNTTPNTATTVNLAWTAPPSGTTTGYQIERESPIGGGWSVLVADTGSTLTTYDDTNLPLSTEFNYRVSAINLGGVSLASNEADITTLSPPTEPLDIVFDLQKISENLRVQVSWTAPVNLFGGVLSNYMVERNVDGAGWNFLTNTGTTPSFVDTDIQRGVNYEYRVSATTPIATGLPSVSNSLEFVDGTFNLPLTAIEGNTLESLSSFTKTSGDPISYATNILIVKHDPNNNAITTVASDNNLINTNSSAIVNGNPVGIELTSGTTQLESQYVYETSEFTYTGYLTTIQDGVTHIFTSANVTVAPLNPFGGSVFANEFRDELTYQTSTVELYAEPAGYDAVIRYQHQDPNIQPFFYAFENIQANNTSISPVLDDKDFYVSVYINPEEFDFEIVNATSGLAEIKCNEDSPLNCPAWDAVYTPSGEVTYSLNPTYGAIEDIPNGIQSDFVTKSFKSPNAPQSFGLEPLGDLFGMPMVFIFIIGLGAVFTGRSAQMGVIFIAVTIGIMIYMGYLSFDFGTSGLSTPVTWGIIIVSMIGGILVGKRWS